MMPPPALLLASASFLSSNHRLAFRPARRSMPHPPPRASSTASFATSTSASASASATSAGTEHETAKPRILCLHGKYQSASLFSNKIAGARRKLAREYHLEFLDGPLLLPHEGDDASNASGDDDLSLAPRAWWHRSSDGKHTLVREAFDYVIHQPHVDECEAVIGFSQGGTLAAALAVSGALPNVRAVVTAGAPFVSEAFDVASEVAQQSASNGFDLPKLHLAGERDAMVPVASTRELCEQGGNGKLIVHEQGHLFPTRAARVKEVLDFLAEALSER